jgi:hypothetical protein
MLIVDDVLFFPARSLFFIFQELHKAALEELNREAEELRADLSQLYLQLEAGTLTEAEFDEREADLLDRLDELEAYADDESAESAADDD